MEERSVGFYSERPEGSIELEGRLYLPEVEGRVPAALLCHPHPMGGGCMDVPLIAVIASYLCSTGMVALRFNFGGVGGSGGKFSDGAEEPADVKAAFEYLASRDEVDEDSISAVGWSFGAWMGLMSLARGLPASSHVAISPPLVAYDWENHVERIAASDSKRYYILGERDQFCPVEMLTGFAKAISEEDAQNITILPGADHFLFGMEDEVARIAGEML